MSDLSLVKTRIRGGVWEGVLSTAHGTGDPPQIEVTHLEKPVETVSVTPDARTPGNWKLSIEIPTELLSDGVQTFLIVDKATGNHLSSFTVVTGEPLEDDIRAEVDLLRAELDMLKRAFRRHCLETMG